MELMPLDSGLCSEGFNLSKQHHKQWEIETKRFKTIRGEVIVLCFEIEYMIGQAIADLLISPKSIRSPEWLHHRHEVFHRVFLDTFDLRRKIDTLCSLLLDRFPNQKDKIKGLNSILIHIKSLRNNMAHCPVIFKAIRRDSKILQPYLETSKGWIPVTEKYIKSNKKNVIEASKIINTLMKKVIHKQTSKIE